MRRVLLIVLLVWPGAAWADDFVDPVAGRLVPYLRALTPGAASAAEILDVMDADAEWPQAGVLARRYADALANERDDRVVDGLCRRRAPGTAPALLRCAGVMAHGEGMARRAWLVGITDAAGEAWFMKRWAAAVGPEVQAARFERLAWSESAAPGGALARQAIRVEPGMRPVAEARLALKRDDAAGPGMVAALTAEGQADPGIVLELARWYRRANRDVEAARVWLERGTAAELAAPAERRGAFWGERNVLVRRLLRARRMGCLCGGGVAGGAERGCGVFGGVDRVAAAGSAAGCGDAVSGCCSRVGGGDYAGAGAVLAGAGVGGGGSGGGGAGGVSAGGGVGDDVLWAARGAGAGGRGGGAGATDPGGGGSGVGRGAGVGVCRVGDGAGGDDAGGLGAEE